MDPKRRLLLVVTRLAMGGAEVQVVDLAVRLKARGWTIGIVSLCPPAALTERLAAAHIPVFSLDVPVGRYSPRLLSRFVRVVRRFKPDVVHTHTLPANLVGRLARPLWWYPVLVTSAHSVNEGGRGRMWAYRATDALTSLTTNVSAAAVDRYLHIGAVPKGRIRCMANGIDLERFRANAHQRVVMRQKLGVPDNTFLWLAVGRFFEAKDYPNLITAASNLPSKHHVMVAGEGALEASIRAQIASSGAPVQLLGPRKDVPALMQAADGYVMSSLWEGLPIVLLEAASSGLPIVATDVGGNAEVVLHERSGFLVPPADPVALNARMKELAMLAPEERSRMGDAGRANVEARFGLEAVVNSWEHMYAELSR